MNKEKLQRYTYLASITCFVLWCVWWVVLNFTDLGGSPDDFTDTYAVTALLGGISALLAGRHWGGLKSTFGAAITCLGFGLVGQFLGQLVYGIMFRQFDVELAFPSIGDMPFFLSMIAYIAGLVYLLKTITFGRPFFKPVVIGVAGIVAMALVIGIAYQGFIKLGIHDERGYVYSTLNVMYPIAKGKLFSAVLLILVALLLQYAGDFAALYQSYHGTWVAAGSSDLLFVLAYGLMTIAINKVDRVRRFGNAHDIPSAPQVVA
jgi:hypothetical protein